MDVTFAASDRRITFTPWVERLYVLMLITSVRIMVPSSAMIMISISPSTPMTAATLPVFSVQL